MFPKFTPLTTEVIQYASQARRMLDLPAGNLTRAERKKYNARWARFLELATQSNPTPTRT